MANVDLNPVSDPFHGRIGSVVFRRVYGKLQAAYRPKPPAGPPTENQLAQRTEFGKAIVWARGALADPVRRALYEQASVSQQKNAFALAVGDYFDVPTVQDVDLEAYRGQPGDKIVVMARDGVAVKGVTVIVRQSDGTIVEQGPAVQVHTLWHYTATTAVPAGANLIIEVAATDWPGNVGKANKLYP